VNQEPELGVVAIDVGGTGIKAAVLNAAGRVVRQIEHPTPVADGPATVIDRVRAIAHELTGPDVVAGGVGGRTG
jgi:predicted NBD/HSP70 family sugar kinase